VLTSCSAARKVRKADHAFADYKYDKARKTYSRAVGKVKDKQERHRVRWQIAECYRYKDDLSNGQEAYKNLISDKYYETQPLVYYHYGNMLLKVNKLDRAVDAFSKYAELMPDDTLGILALERIVLANEYEINPGKYEITPMKKINSQWDDFSPTYSNSALNEIIFTSNRGAATGKNKDEWTGSKFTDLFVARKSLDGKWGDPVLLETDGTINTPVNEGSPAMSGRFTTLYFTRCEKPEDRAGGCAIYRSKRQGMVWGEPQRLELVADSSAVIGHPTVSPDESLLIVSAELPGGKGKRDLWYATGIGGSFGELQNLGSVINTPGDEMFPHLRGDSVLYFSSDYLPGMGGLDIFRSRITYNDGVPFFSEPVNLRYPINSVGDDFGICFHPEGSEEGYFSTRRKANEGANIYSFLLEPVIFTISGFVRDRNSMLYVAGVTITLIGSDSSFITMRTGENGTFLFPKTQVKANMDYTVVIEKEGYISSEEKVSTKGLDVSKNFKIEVLNFQPIPREPVVLPEILFDYGKWDLKPIFQDSLRGLILILEANPNITIELGAHTDSRGSAEANRDLAQKRAQSVVDYLIERGIEPDRVTAKGYGEDVPRVLHRDFIRDGFTFPKGTELNDDYVNSLKSRINQEAAHQMNRRIEFIVTSVRYQAKDGAQRREQRAVAIDINELRRGVPFEPVGKKDLPQMACFINGLSEAVILNESERNAIISLKSALDLLRDGYITKDDFEGNPEKVLAGGTIAKGAKFVINDLKIGLRSEYDILVTVDSNYDLPLTIPASVMKRFGDYTIDREKNMLFFED